MSSGTLALFIFIAISAQVALFMLYRYNQHKREYRQLDARAPEATVELSPDRPASPEAATRAAVWEGLRRFRVQRRVMEDAAVSACSFYLVPVDAQPLPLFKPGQFLTFSLQIPDPTTGELKNIVRCYSLSDRPRTDYYRVTIKRLPPPENQPDAPPGVCSNFFHDQVQEDSELLVKPPSGHFHLMEDEPLPVVLVAGGIGLTPLFSILNTLLYRNTPREVWLFYGVRNGAEHVMKEHLLSLASAHPCFHLHICYSRPTEQDKEGIDYQHPGHVDIQRLRLCLPLARYQFYVCGPRAMMESLIPALEHWGVATQEIYYEAFGPASLPRHKQTTAVEDLKMAAMQPISVTFSRSGKRLHWSPDAESLLAFAENNGIKLDSGCRAGSCGTCQTQLEAGEVEYSQEPDAEIEAGHCLLCISTPKTDLTLNA